MSLEVINGIIKQDFENLRDPLVSNFDSKYQLINWKKVAYHQLFRSTFCQYYSFDDLSEQASFQSKQVEKITNATGHQPLNNLTQQYLDIPSHEDFPETLKVKFFTAKKCFILFKIPIKIIRISAYCVAK